jgi:hypothetical protein
MDAFHGEHVMKLSNLARRTEPEMEQQAAETPAHAPDPAGIVRAARRLERTRRMGLDYRAIVIRDDGLRPFRVR